MSRVAIYVFWQLLAAFLLTLAGMTSVLVFGIIAKEGVRQGLGVVAILRMLPYALPDALRFAVPASILLSACSVFGRIAADNEVVAIKSLGINPRVLLWPAFTLAIAISVGMIYLNDAAVTWGAAGMRSVIAESVEQVVLRMLKTERSFKNKFLEISVRDVRGHRLIGPRFERKGKDRIQLEATEAELRTDLENQQLIVSLTDCTYNTPFGKGADPRTFEISVPLSMATKKGRRELRVSQLGLGTITDEATTQQGYIRQLRQQLAARAAFQMTMGDFAQLGAKAKQLDDSSWAQLHADLREAELLLNRLRTEPWRRYAEGFSCLCIVMVGAPLAMIMRTTNFFTTFAMCFFPVLCVYYPLVQWASDSAKDGVMPPYTVWIGNLVLVAAGLWLTRKVVRY